MLRDIDDAKELGADGVVVGNLNPEGNIDKDKTAEQIERARPMSVTFHRAFDMARDPFEALDDLTRLGVDRVLTSGQEPSALAGLDLLVELVGKAGDQIIVMPCGDINVRNVRKVIARTGARELHVTGTKAVESGMKFRNERVYMGGELRPPEYSRATTDEERIKELVRLSVS
jgi:copper homeostasis protein